MSDRPDPTTLETGPGPGQPDRRRFLGWMGAGAAATVVASGIGSPLVGTAEAADFTVGSPQQRRVAARKLRRDMAQLAFERPMPVQTPNGEEQDYPYVANFSKGLPHDDLGEVDPAAYALLLEALESGEPEAFEQIPLGGDRKLRNPKAGLAFDLEGCDSHHLASRAAPRIDGPENSSEAGELYWMALARDVAFNDYATDPLVAAAAQDLSQFSDFRGPKEGGQVTPATIFRGNAAGDRIGPYVSQFLLRDIPYGSLTISQRQQTGAPGIDFMTGFASWLAVQRGVTPGVLWAADPTPRHIRNGRDLAAYVRVDALYEAYLNACLILLGLNAPFDPGNPYLTATRTDGFGTFGGPHILTLVTEVATRALKAVWYQKWFVHRRLRPEAFGGRVHLHLSGTKSYPIDDEILGSAAPAQVFAQNGTYLLPQAYGEGSPLHPSYGAGHATVAGACVTILKAWFDESFVLPDPVVPDASGTALLPYTGADSGLITVGGELDKVAANVASARNFAGIHWRTDMSESLKLGEEVALTILEEQRDTYRESASFTLTRFDGTTITI